ncbi:MAG TPA: hypothetical protein VK165_18930 [Azonexus sp.]|nr:hypothetical protein [Azonexus sp.]
MAEPSTSAGVSLTVIAVALLGPMFGPYALIVFAALAGAMWPLSAARTESMRDGAWLLMRCTLTAVVLTVFLANLLERFWEIPKLETLGPVAFLIGGLGNGWRPVLDSIGEVLNAVVVRARGQQ